MHRLSHMARVSLEEAEAWAKEGRRFHARGEHHRALEQFRRSCEAVPGRSRLELDTAELARRLGKPELAVYHYRRAAAAYLREGFARHSLAPLRTALHLEQSRLPASADSVIAIAQELASALVALGFAGDARQVIESSAAAFEERNLEVPNDLESLRPPAPGRLSKPAPRHPTP
jgi:hypothetical protein